MECTQSLLRHLVLDRNNIDTLANVDETARAVVNVMPQRSSQLARNRDAEGPPRDENHFYFLGVLNLKPFYSVFVPLVQGYE